MAKKDTKDFNAVLSDIRARRFAPVYLLMGEESYFIDRLCETLAETILTPEEREFNQFVVFGIDVSAQQIAAMAREYPMMAEYKVIIVKEAQMLGSTDDLDAYLDHFSPQTILIYCHKNGTIDSRKKFVKKVETVGLVFRSDKVKEYQLPAFVKEFVAARGKTIDPPTAATIAAAIGSDLCRLATELDKLCLAMDDGATAITPLLVEETLGVSRQYNPFELRRAVAEYDVRKSYNILNYFAKNPKAGGVYALVPILFSFFQNLMVAWHAPNKSDWRGVGEYLNIKTEYQVREYLTGMKHYTESKTIQIIAKIREIDEKLKGLNSTGATDDNDLAKELLFFIFH